MEAFKGRERTLSPHRVKKLAGDQEKACPGCWRPSQTDTAQKDVTCSEKTQKEEEKNTLLLFQGLYGTLIKK